MRTSTLERLARTTTRDAIEKAIQAGINIRPEYPAIIEKRVQEMAQQLNKERAIAKRFTVQIEETSFGHLGSNQLRVSILGDLSPKGISCYVAERIGDGVSPQTLPPSRTECQRFRRLFLPHLELPREIKSKIAQEYYTSGLHGLILAIEGYLSGTARIKAHLMAILTVMTPADYQFVEAYPLYRRCRLLKVAFWQLVMNNTLIYHQ